MPAEDLLVKTYDNWKGGPWHYLGPDNGPKQGHFYESVNLQVYSNGTLGVRPKLGRITSDTLTITPANLLGCVAYHPSYDFTMQDGDAQVWILEGGDTTPYVVDLQTGVSTNPSTPMLSPAPKEQPKPPRYLVGPQVNYGTIQAFTQNDIKGIVGGEGRIDNVVTGGSTAITHPASWLPHTIISHRDRYWSWGDTTETNRIYYSVIGDVTDWTNAEFISVGADTNLPIRGVWRLYDSLLICMKDFRWYIFRYADDPQYGEIRYIGTKRVPDYSVAAAETGDAVLFLSIQGGITVVTPESIDDVSLDYIRPDYGFGTSRDFYFLRGLFAEEESAVCLPYALKNPGVVPGDFVTEGDHSFDLVNGVWVKSRYFGRRTSPIGTTILDWYKAGSDGWGCLAEASNGGSTAALYVREISLDRPSRTADFYSSITEVPAHDGVETSSNLWMAELQLERFHPPEGSTCQLEKVIIDFDHWKDTGTYPDPFFVCQMYYGHHGDVFGPIQIDTLDPTDYDTVASDTPERARAVFTPTIQPAASWIQVVFDTIDGIAFDSINLHFRVQTQEELTTRGDT